MSALPHPSDLGALALATLRDELIPALPPHLRYTAAMTARALDYALGHDDDALWEGDEEARALADQIACGTPPDDVVAQLEQHLARERSKIAPLTSKEPSR